ncbi:MAG: hypothetical protein ABJC60_04725 [Actinomycetota bacterium]
MPTETTKGTDRCETHPGTPSVADCGRCGRALCIACAVPVRGAVLGPECLPPDVAAEVLPQPAQRAPIPRWWAVTGIALMVLVGSTLFAWTRFGVASGWFGAWGIPLRWSMVTAVAGVLALGLWVMTRRAPGRGIAGALVMLSVVAGAGAELSILNPPPFARATVAPWVAVISAAIAAGAALTTVLRIWRTSAPRARQSPDVR